MLKKISFFVPFILLAILLQLSCGHFKNEGSCNKIHGVWEQTDDFNTYYFINSDSILIEGVSSIKVISNKLNRGLNSNKLEDNISIIDHDSIQLIIENNKSVTLRKISDTIITPTTNRGIINIDTIGNMKCLGYRINGRQHGIWVCTNLNDEIKTLTRWYNGEKNGVELQYVVDSTVISKGFYRNNVLLYSEDLTQSAK